MTRQEVKEVIQEQLQDTEPEVVASAFMEMYLDGKITIDDLKFAVDECGFELDEEFANASFEDQKKMTTPPDKEENKEEKPEEEKKEEENNEEKPEEEKKEEENKEEEAKEENTKEEEAPEEERASKSEGYDGEKVYDKQGQPTQVNQSTGSEDNNEKEKAEKLFNVSF